MSVELKPCPFCGKEPKEVGSNIIGISVFCGNSQCPATPMVEGRNRATAYPAWNTRSLSQDTNGPIRMFIALRLMRAWNNGTEGFDGLLVKTINDWIDGGMQGPIPWVENPFFADWAQMNGYSRVGDHIGFRMTAILSNG